MVGILLTILKIIGIILLVILALVLVLLAVVLFVPFRYSAVVDKADLGADAGMTDGLAVQAAVTWLLHLVSLRFRFADGETGLKLKVAGINLLKKKKEKKPKKKKVKKGEERTLLEISQGKKKHVEPAAEEEKESTAEPAAAEETVQQVAADAGEPAAQLSAQEPAEEKKEGPVVSLLWKIGEKIWAALVKIHDKWVAFKKKMKPIFAKIRKYLDFAEDERTQKAAKLTLSELGKLLKGFLPKKIKGYVHYGSSDVYETGKTLAVLSAVYPLYQGKVDVIPDFEEKALDGHVELAGRIFTASVVKMGLKLILNKNVKYVIKFFKNKEDHKGPSGLVEERGGIENG